jgi:hypothetical protein
LTIYRKSPRKKFSSAREERKFFDFTKIRAAIFRLRRSAIKRNFSIPGKVFECSLQWLQLAREKNRFARLTIWDIR